LLNGDPIDSRIVPLAGKLGDCFRKVNINIRLSSWCHNSGAIIVSKETTNICKGMLQKNHRGQDPESREDVAKFQSFLPPGTLSPPWICEQVLYYEVI